MFRAVKYLVASIAFLFLATVVCGLSYRWYAQYRISNERSIRVPPGIDTLEAVRIGGIEQWIHVRGENTSNPILLFIHGGPGQAFIPMAGLFQGPWEKHFTVVQWDQRGAGKTYAANDRELQRRTMTVAQMQQDTVDVVDHLRHRFKRDKILVMGASWGSMLGLWLAHEHPDIVEAYVGVAQTVKTELADRVAYADALEVARRQGNAKAIADLESVAPDPASAVDLRKGSIRQTWQAELLGPPPGPTQFLNMRRLLLTLWSAPEYSLADVYGFTRGQMFSLEVMIPQIGKVDLTRMGREFRVPVFFFQGRRDPYCRPSLIEEYAQTISAPRHELVWFEQAGHFPFFEEQQRFSEELTKRLLPRP